MAEQLTQSNFDIKTAEIQASQKLLPKVKAPVVSSNSHRRGLAASVASRPSSVCSASAELVDVRPVLSSLDKAWSFRFGVARCAHIGFYAVLVCFACGVGAL